MPPKRSVTITAAWIAILGVLILACATIAVPFIQYLLNGQTSSSETEYIGHVVDANTLQSIAGAKITLNLEGVPPIVYTDSEGLYRFKVEINSNISGQITVDAPGYPVYTRNITISPGTNTIEEIRLTPTSTVTTITQTPIASPISPTLTLTADGLTPSLDGSDHIDSFGVPMRLVPAGSFMMGSNADAAVAECEQFGIDCNRESFINEEPVHEVYLDDYYIDKYEVTNKLYEACVNARACSPPIQSWSFNQDDYYGNPKFYDYPVVFVNWDMAETYCEWRGAKLPTEAQWEKAARDNDGRIFPWGNDLDYKYANFDQIIRDTTMVSQYEKGKSPYGVYDLAGNTIEWVYDLYAETYYQNSPSSNPMGPSTDQGDGRVVRGGSWFDKEKIRSAYRSGWEPAENADGLGFRCAMNVNP